jgi:hypothetical protein
MSNRSYALILAGVLAIIVVAVAMHQRGGGSLSRLAQAIHGHR